MLNFHRIIKLLAYLTALVFIINRVISRPAKPEKPQEQSKLEVPEYVTSSEDPRGLLLGGRKFLEEGKLELAEVAFARATELDPKLRDAWLHLGISRLALGKHFASELALRRARAIDPLYPETYRQLIKLYEAVGNEESLTATRNSLKAVER